MRKEELAIKGEDEKLNDIAVVIRKKDEDNNKEEGGLKIDSKVQKDDGDRQNMNDEGKKKVFVSMCKKKLNGKNKSKLPGAMEQLKRTGRGRKNVVCVWKRKKESRWEEEEWKFGQKVYYFPQEENSNGLIFQGEERVVVVKKYIFRSSCE